jgi:hypothetical protein
LGFGEGVSKRRNDFGRGLEEGGIPLFTFFGSRGSRVGTYSTRAEIIRINGTRDFTWDTKSQLLIPGSKIILS